MKSLYICAFTQKGKGKLDREKRTRPRGTVRQLQFPTRAPHLSDFLASNCCSNCRMNGTIKSCSSRQVVSRTELEEEEAFNRNTRRAPSLSKTLRRSFRRNWRNEDDNVDLRLSKEESRYFESRQFDREQWINLFETSNVINVTSSRVRCYKITFLHPLLFNICQRSLRKTQ